MGEEAVYTTAEVADMLGVSRWLVRKWVKAGELEAALIGGSKGYVIGAGDLARFRQAKFGKTKR